MRTNVIVALIALFICLGVIGGVAYVQLKPEPKKEMSLAEKLKASLAAYNSTESQSTLGVGTNELGQLGVESNPDQSNSASSPPPILTPDQFVQYDELKDSDQIITQNLQLGTGAEVVKGKKVAVVYKGWLTNAEVFDQSRVNEKKEVEPFIFTPGAGQVIQGWELGVIGMKEGGTRRLIIPPIGGYGEQGNDAVPPNSVLIFDIQVIEVEK